MRFLLNLPLVWRDRRGSVAIIVGLSAPVLFALVAGAVEVADVARAKIALQSYVDAAALAGAQGYGLDPSARTTERARVQADGAADNLRPRWAVQTSASSNQAQGAVTVTQDGVRNSLFGNLLPPGGFHIHATATASTLAKKTPLCVLATDTVGPNVVRVRDLSRVLASNCLVQSNSDIQVDTAAQILGGAVRSVGATSGAVLPFPTTDAPVIPDPFASLAINVPTSCSDKDFLVSGTTTMNPGVHCGNIKINGTDRLVLNPGEHYFLNCQIDVIGQGEIVGTDVVMIFSGKFDIGFKGKAYLSIEGRHTGPYAGFAIVTDRSFTGTVEISTDSARQILGTVYLPQAQFLAGGANLIGDLSAWTVIVSKRLQVQGLAQLVINTNYIGSAVPLPGGVSTNVSTRLTH